jgi:hypothetical protein
MGSPVGLQRIGSLPQENPREFGDGLHERVLGVVGGPFQETLMNGRLFVVDLWSQVNGVASCTDRLDDASAF